jgi:ankyrin repeat protein
MTPLMIAARRGRSDVVSHLLTKGADVGVTDKKGKTAIDHAKDAKQNAVVELLQKGAAAPK